MTDQEYRKPKDLANASEHVQDISRQPAVTPITYKEI